MPRTVAIALTFLLILALFVWDRKRNRDASPALWLPIVWILIVGSRFPSQWLALGDRSAFTNISDGSPLDAAVFLALIVLGSVVLMRRRLVIGDLLRNNFWIVALMVYGLVSILWSDFPFIAFKRWVKALGHPIMALIVLTDPNPGKAFRTVMKRCAFVLLPLSVLFIKYLPEYGRAFDYWTGAPTNRGIMLTKNDLGYVCMVFVLFFVWTILSRKSIENPRERREEVLLSVGFLGMIAWLMGMANSATSLATATLGAGTIVLLGTRLINKRYVGTYFVVFLFLAVFIESTFDVYAKIVEALGRDPTLTDRTQVWADAIGLQTKPLFGMGFESFWLGSRLDYMSEKWWWRPHQAHNGYIETYLNFGVIGLCLFLALLVSTFRKISASLPSDFEFSRFRLGMLVAILAHNYTEATFKGVHLLWTMFHVIAVNYRKVPEKVPEKAPQKVPGKPVPARVSNRMEPLRRRPRGSSVPSGEAGAPTRASMALRAVGRRSAAERGRGVDGNAGSARAGR